MILSSRLTPQIQEKFREELALLIHKGSRKSYAGLQASKVGLRDLEICYLCFNFSLL
jgi:hypothetical protein